MSNLVRLSVLDTYGVRWSRETFARDIMQNFFDANGDFERMRLAVDREGGVVEVWGPQSFDLTLLFYIGATTKSDDSTVGGFGEGFKICALVGIRDFGLQMTAGSGERRFEVVFEPVPLGRELCYRWLLPTPGAEGAWVRLEGCDGELLDAFVNTPNLFRHAKHPDLQRPIALSADGRAGLFQVKGEQPGAVFYRRQHRGAFKWDDWFGHQKVHLVHDAAIEALEGDRDRRDLPVYPVAQAVGAALEPEALFQAFVYLKRYWEYGRHELLAGLVDAAVKRQLKWPREQWAEAGQPDPWLARGRKGEESQNQLAERQGFKLAMTSFGELGMPRTGEFYVPSLESRDPTPLEAARMQVITDLYGALVAPPTHKKRFEVFDDLKGTAAIQGQHFGDRILMNAAQLHGPMWIAAETLLHEHAHEAGGDADEKFWQRLERLLYGVVSRPEQVVAARDRFEALNEAQVAVEAQAAREAAEAEAVRKAAEAAAMPHVRAAEGIDPRVIRYADATKLGSWATRHLFRLDRLYAIHIYAPPGMVSLVDWVDALLAATKSVPAGVLIDPVYAPEQVQGARLRGLPTLRINGRELPPDAGPDRDDGLGLQTWAGRLLPTVDRVVAALDAEKPIGALELYGVFQPSSVFLRQARPEPPKPLAQRLEEAMKARWPVSYGLYASKDVLKAAHHQVSRLAREQVLATEPTDFDAALAEATRRTEAAIAVGEQLRKADVQYDRLDPLDVACMDAAEGLAVVLAIRGEPAEPAFARVRALFDEVLAVELAHEHKEGLFMAPFDTTALTVPLLDNALRRFQAEVARRVRSERASWLGGAAPPRRPEPPAAPKDTEAERLRQQQQYTSHRAWLLKWARMVDVWDAAVALGLDEQATARRLLAAAPAILREEEAP